MNNPNPLIETAIKHVAKLELSAFTPERIETEINDFESGIVGLSEEQQTQAVETVRAVFNAFKNAAESDRPTAWIEPATIRELLPYHSELLTEIETRIPGAVKAFQDHKAAAEKDMYMRIKEELLDVPLADVMNAKTLDEFKALSPILNTGFAKTVFDNRKIGGEINNLEDLMIVVDAYEGIELDRRIPGDVARKEFKDKMDDQLVNYYATLICQLDEEVNFKSADDKLVERHKGLNSRTITYLKDIRNTYNADDNNTEKIKEKTESLDVIITTGNEDEFFDEIFKGPDSMRVKVRELYNDKIDSYKNKRARTEAEKSRDANERLLDSSYKEKREALDTLRTQHREELDRAQQTYQTELGQLRTAHADEVRQLNEQIRDLRNNDGSDKLRLYQQAAGYIVNPASFQALDNTERRAFYDELAAQVPEAAQMFAAAMNNAYKAEKFDNLQ